MTCLYVTVIVVTLRRPDCVRRCLTCLRTQEPQPEQIIVVDTSEDEQTREVVSEFAGVVYLHGEHGYGHMTASRNMGLLSATGDIIAFVDDDAFAQPGWLANLTAAYTDDTIGAVGGRALNKQPGEEVQGPDGIGRIKPNGQIIGGFAADPGSILEVDHIIGCNMSFRRSVLAMMGGLREDYPGTEVREESDVCLRVRKLGFRILFNPAACVDHIGAPQVKGKRFDTRYAYYDQRNHLVMLIRNYGLFSGIVWRYLTYSETQALKEVGRRIGAAIARLAVNLAGSVSGIAAGVTLLIKSGVGPIRRDARGQEITAALQESRPPQTRQGLHNLK